MYKYVQNVYVIIIIYLQCADEDKSCVMKKKPIRLNSTIVGGVFHEKIQPLYMESIHQNLCY